MYASPMVRTSPDATMADEHLANYVKSLINSLLCTAPSKDSKKASNNKRAHSTTICWDQLAKTINNSLKQSHVTADQCHLLYKQNAKEALRSSSPVTARVSQLQRARGGNRTLKYTHEETFRFDFSSSVEEEPDRHLEMLYNTNEIQAALNTCTVPHVHLNRSWNDKIRTFKFTIVPFTHNKFEDINRLINKKEKRRTPRYAH